MPPACRTAANVATNVFAGTITSSPGSIPAASRPSRSASRPLDIPTQCAAPQYAANALLELRHLRPVVEPARVEQFGDVGQDGFVQRPAARGEVDERDESTVGRRMRFAMANAVLYGHV